MNFARKRLAMNHKMNELLEDTEWKQEELKICCDKCGQHLLIYDNTANCRGVFVKCKRCGKEVEIKI